LDVDTFGTNHWGWVEEWGFQWLRLGDLSILQDWSILSAAPPARRLARRVGLRLLGPTRCNLLLLEAAARAFALMRLQGPTGSTSHLLMENRIMHENLFASYWDDHKGLSSFPD
jgi:hypothetical protein